MSFPREFVRVTNHSKPRYQVYQPGFNPQNSCWVPGEWVTLKKPDWDAQKAEYEALAPIVRAASKKQHYRDPGTPVERMTPMQRKAWEFHGGTITFEAICANGRLDLVGVKVAGNTLRTQDLEWLRVHKKAKIIRYIKRGPNSKVVDQLAEITGVPEDLVHDEVVDVLSLRTKQHWEGEYNTFLSFVESTKRGGGRKAGMSLEGAVHAMSFLMVGQFLIRREEAIIRAEWELSKGKEIYEPLADLVESYRQMRRDAADVQDIEGILVQARTTHNHCARTNLDNSNGYIAAFVLPAFNADGTHEPWGERDVPWSWDPNKSPWTMD